MDVVLPDGAEIKDVFVPAGVFEEALGEAHASGQRGEAQAGMQRGDCAACGRQAERMMKCGRCKAASYCDRRYAASIARHPDLNGCPVCGWSVTGVRRLIGRSTRKHAVAELE